MITHLLEAFAVMGVPKTMKTDNALALQKCVIFSLPMVSIILREFSITVQDKSLLNEQIVCLKICYLDEKGNIYGFS